MSEREGGGVRVIVTLWVLVIAGAAGGFLYLRSAKRVATDDGVQVTRTPEDRPSKRAPTPTSPPPPEPIVVPEPIVAPEPSAVPTAVPATDADVAADALVAPAYVSGSFTGDVSRVVAANRGRFRKCLETALGTNPDAGGKTVVNVTLGPKGEVTAAKASSSDASPDLTRCVVDSFKLMKFPEPESGTTTELNIPVVLHAN